MCSTCDDTVLRLIVSSVGDLRVGAARAPAAPTRRPRGGSSPAGSAARRLTRWPAAVSTALTASPSSRPSRTSSRIVATAASPSNAGRCGRGSRNAWYTSAAASSLRRHRERVARQPVRVAAPVEALVMLRRARHDRRQRRHAGEHAPGEVGVGSRPLLLRERPRLGRVPHRARHAHHADVVDRARAPQVRGVGVGHARGQGRFTGQLGDTARVADA